ncbi:MAG: pyridoxal phosphate-dependent aminotransferase [Anaerolineales bacterium]
MPASANRLDNLTDSVINQMNILAEEHTAINLASGYPDSNPPQELLEAAGRAMHDGFNQYANPWGSPRLRQALAEKSTRFMGIELDAEEHITVTCGGTEAMLVAMLSVCNPGDKVIVFSPYYETYTPDIALAGAEPLFVSLRPPSFEFDPDELRQAFAAGAKALVLCNPSNPCGKVFTLQELQTIASLAQEFDAFVITDEVYEHIVYSPHYHTYIASLPGMFERTLSCSSLSKTYDITGWRLGYIISAPQLTSGVRRLHDYLTLCAPAPLQEAAAVGLRFPDSYYVRLQAGYARRRDHFLRSLDQAGLGYFPPQGTYFVLADISRFGYPDDHAFCRWMAAEIGVVGVPGSYFFHKPETRYVRLNFAKNDATMAEAGRRLAKLRTLP